MKNWNPDHYLKFKNERTQPSIDLVGRINGNLIPEDIIDVGCGPGNSTQVLKQRWPLANVIGIDKSHNMIEKAQAEYPDMNWQVSDIVTFKTPQKYDLVYSNAAIQWIPNHETLLRKMAGLLKDSGVMAIQVPQFRDMILGQVIDNISKNDRWSEKVSHCRELFTYHPFTYYYDLLTELFTKVEMWETFYLHEMQSHEAIVDWIKSTGMKPYIDSLSDEDEKTQFAAAVLEEIKYQYPTQKNGKVLFPFKRLFFIGEMEKRNEEPAQ
jgi:trans-aconitate 2-methyltransferase